MLLVHAPGETPPASAGPTGARQAAYFTIIRECTEPANGSDWKYQR
jgi:hypothetical protein